MYVFAFWPLDDPIRAKVLPTSMCRMNRGSCSIGGADAKCTLERRFGTRRGEYEALHAALKMNSLFRGRV